MQVSVVEENIVSVAERAEAVLVARTVQRVIDKGQSAFGAAQAPDDFARVAVDFGALAVIAAGEQDVPVIIHINGVHVREINNGSREIHELLLAQDIHVIPGPPLEDQLARRRKLLHHIFRYRGGGIASRNITTHINRLSAVADQIIGAIRKDLQFMVVGVISVDGGVARDGG